MTIPTLNRSLGAARANAADTWSIAMPMALVSEANDHRHWRTRQKRAKQQIGTTALYLAQAGVPRRCPRLTVVYLSSDGPNRLDDDNYPVSFKHVRDSIAKWFGIDDGTDAVHWVYLQQTISKDRLVRIGIVFPAKGAAKPKRAKVTGHKKRRAR